MKLGPRFRIGVLLLAAWLHANAAARSWGDQGDGTYRNPVLAADYSDPDVIRVGGDFYLVASDFHFMGIQVLHSRDLVNWRIVGQVFDRLPLHAKYDEMNAYGQGTWAPSLRFHEGQFYLYVCTPEDGLLQYRAKDPAGPWTLTVVKKIAGWEDPCPFWDDDGNAYLVRGQLGAGPIFLHRMSTDGTQLLDDGVEIYRGPVAEGPKVYKRRGWYYISLPEGGVGNGGQTMLRARSLAGPYERREVLPYGSPHQGGIVDLDNGESWFIGFKSTGHLGRLPHLVPVTWGEDDWPVFGDQGKSVTQWKKPTLPAADGATPSVPATSDEFDANALGAQWQWNHNPIAANWSLGERPGWLRLRGAPAAEIRVAPNTLTQKLWSETGVVDAKISVAGLTDGQRAGIAFQSGNTFAWAGVARRQGVVNIAWDWGGGPRVTGDAVWLRAVYTGDRGRLYYSVDGVRFVDSGLAPQLRAAQWKGARVALFCFGPGGGALDVDYFRYAHGDEPAVKASPVTLADGTRASFAEAVGASSERAVMVLVKNGEQTPRIDALVQALARRDIASVVVPVENEIAALRAVVAAREFLAQRLAGPDAQVRVGVVVASPAMLPAAAASASSPANSVAVVISPAQVELTHYAEDRREVFKTVMSGETIADDAAFARVVAEWVERAL